MSILDLNQSGAFQLVRQDEQMPGRQIIVHGYRPLASGSDGAVVFVQHGMLRNGGDYRDFWIDAAEKYGLCIVAATYSDDDWPGTRDYNDGALNCCGTAGEKADIDASTYATLRRIILDVAASGSIDPDRMYLFGHSAGGQFVHRYLSLFGAQHLRGVIAANSGWYSLPTLDRDFPEGLRGTGLNSDGLQCLFSYPLQLFVGQADNDPQAANLPDEPAARSQGASRLLRARHYYEFAQTEARRRNMEFTWDLHEIPEVAHDGKLMSHVAAEHWFGDGIPSAAALKRSSQSFSFVA